MEDKNYAAICLNGHVIASYLKSNDPYDQFCKECGEQTINACPVCFSKIDGSGDILFTIGHKFKIPKFCPNCGTQYPWSIRVNEAASELIQFSEELNDQEKSDFISSIPSLLLEGPKTNIAILKFKKYTQKAGGLLADGLKKIIIEVVSESVKKSLWN